MNDNTWKQLPKVIRKENINTNNHMNNRFFYCMILHYIHDSLDITIQLHLNITMINICLHTNIYLHICIENNLSYIYNNSERKKCHEPRRFSRRRGRMFDFP